MAKKQGMVRSAAGLSKQAVCSCGCGDTVATCKCGSDCSCRKAGGSCFKAGNEKAGRCWSGYEAVPGKKPYSDDSCRPVGSSKKKKPAAVKEARAKLVFHLDNMAKLAAEMRTYNVVGLQKAAALGIGQHRRLKYAALAAQYQYEKQAFTSTLAGIGKDFGGMAKAVGSVPSAISGGINKGINNVQTSLNNSARQGAVGLNNFLQPARNAFAGVNSFVNHVGQGIDRAVAAPSQIPGMLGRGAGRAVSAAGSGLSGLGKAMGGGK